MAHVGQLGGDVAILVETVAGEYFPHVQISTEHAAVMSLRLDEAKALIADLSRSVWHLEHPPLFDGDGR